MNSFDIYKKSSIDNCKILDIPTVYREIGSITVFENLAEAPFDVRRIYFTYDIPAGAERGGHSHNQTSELVIPLVGSFDVEVDDGSRTRRVALNRPDQGLLLPPGIWRTLDNFSAGAICLVLASEEFLEEDYVREYDKFKLLTSSKS